MKVYTHCAKIQTTESQVIYKKAKYNTGLGQPRVGSWARGRIIWRLCTQLVVGREGINVNSSDSLHNTGPQERVMELMHKNRRPPCFHTQSNLAGTQKDRGFVLMTGDHTKLLLDLPAPGIHQFLCLKIGILTLTSEGLLENEVKLYSLNRLENT